MNELRIDQFREVIRKTHNVDSKLTGRAHVRDTFSGRVVWEGEVLIFDLYSHPTAPKCYAWSVEGRVTAVLHESQMDSPHAAVRAAIAAEHRCPNCGTRVLTKDHACPNCGRVL
jgi:DNA-directed RNA polymerase subunit RPC12/RpoP